MSSRSVNKADTFDTGSNTILPITVVVFGASSGWVSSTS